MFLTILSGLFGGILRLAPEVLKFFDAKNDREHELAMQDKQLAFLQAQGTLKVEEARIQTSADVQTSQFNAYMAAYQAENTMLERSPGWVNSINALIRPSVTFGVFTLWALCRLSVVVYSWHSTGNMVESMMNAWTADDAALLSMIGTFYFVGRSIDKNK